MSAASLVARLMGTLSIWEREQRHKAWHCSSWMAQGSFVLRDFIWAGGLHRIFITVPGVLQYIDSSKCVYRGVRILSGGLYFSEHIEEGPGHMPVCPEAVCNV